MKKGNQATTSEVHSDCDLENALFGSEVAESCQSTKLQDLSGTQVAGSTLEERDVRCAIKTKCGHSVSMRWPEGKSKSISSTEVSSVNAGEATTSFKWSAFGMYVHVLTLTMVKCNSNVIIVVGVVISMYIYR